MKFKIKLTIILIAVIVISAVVVGFNFREAIAGIIRIITTGSATVTVKSPDNNGLVGFWNFDDCDTCATAKDYSGQGKDGTITDANASGLKNRVAGKINNALSFDGVDDYVSVPDSDNWAFGTNDFAIAFWVKRLDSNQLRILSQYQNNNNRWYVSFTPAPTWNNELSLGVNSGGTWIINLAWANVLQNANTWYHVALVRSGGSTYELFVDGVSKGTQTSSSVFPNMASSLFMGVDWWNSALNVKSNMVLDELKIFNRALSAAEAQTLYEGTRRVYVNTSQNIRFTDGLVGMWSFNGPDMDWSQSTTEARDSSGSGNHGDVTNFGQEAARPGVVGQALNFDGTNDYVQSADSNNNFDFGTNPMSLAFWFNENAFAGGAVGHYVIDTRASGDTSNKYAIYERTQKLRFFSASGEVLTSNSSISLNTWTHVAFVRENTGAGGFKLYLNGSLDNTGTNGDTLNAAVFTIGSKWDINADEAFQGLIDEVRIYNRAFSAAEVYELYKLGSRE